jgi:hypothetical protein
MLVTPYLASPQEIGGNDRRNTLSGSFPAAVGELFRQMENALRIGQKGIIIGQSPFGNPGPGFRNKFPTCVFSICARNA